MNRALALVRPVSMTDETASDWLAAAIAETAEMSDAAFGVAVAKARKTCTFHGQIIPAIVSGIGSEPKRDPFAWALACHAPSQPVLRIEGTNGDPRTIGNIVKGIEYDGDR